MKKLKTLYKNILFLMNNDLSKPSFTISKEVVKSIRPNTTSLKY